MNIPLVLYITALLLGLLSIVAGVYVLWGPGFALLAGGGQLFAIASFLRKGMTDG